MFILSIVFYQSEGHQAIVAELGLEALNIFLAKTASVLVYDLRFTGHLVDEPYSLFREV